MHIYESWPFHRLNQSILAASAVLLLCAAVLPAQRRVDAHWNYHRVIAVLPMQGSGSAADPIRPKHAPMPQAGSPSRSGHYRIHF